MASCNSRAYYEKLQGYADEYLAKTGKERARSVEIAMWMISTGRWEAPPDLALRKCREDISRALREQYFKDSHGRSIRAKHAARTKEGEDQLTFWADIRTAPRGHMEIAFQQRREQIVGDCRQLNRDVDFFNEAHPGEQPIQMEFDFRDDIEEGQFSGEFGKRS